MSDSTSHPRFSPNHGFSQSEVAQAATQGETERRGKRLFMNVTMGHRRLEMRQVTVSSVVGAITMLSLYLAEQAMPTIGRKALNIWALATFANIVVRATMNYWMFNHSPAEMANSTVRRLVPLAVVDSFLLLVRYVAGTYQPAQADEVLHAAQTLVWQQLLAREVLSSPQVVRDFLRVRLGALEQEVFAVLMHGCTPCVDRVRRAVSRRVGGIPYLNTDVAPSGKQCGGQRRIHCLVARS